MAMKFKTEQKGQMFLVVNETTGVVKGRFKEKGEADVYRNRLQDQHNTAIQNSQSKLSPPTAAGGSDSDNFEAGD